MGTGFFAVGALIFALYMYFTIWNIFNGSKKQREENGPVADETDMDGMGNFSRFPTSKKEEMD